MSKNLWVNREQPESLIARNIMNYCSVIQKANKVIATHTHLSERMSSVNLATKTAPIHNSLSHEEPHSYLRVWKQRVNSQKPVI